MPDYKRKKVHTKKRRSPKAEVQKVQADIPMRREKKIKTDITEDSSIRVVKGKKLEKRKKFFVVTGAVAAIVAILLILSAILPVGLFESAQNLVLSIGGGSFPLDLSGTAVIDCVPNDNYYYVLTDTNIMAFSNGGKRIFSFVHGFSSPIIKVSETRALVFDQNKNTAIIYNLSGVIDTIQSKDRIITADIARDGQYALVTKSDSYASTVSVYSRKDKPLYSINLAKESVNNIDIASSGKKIAVSTITAFGGNLASGIRIYEFDSADPVFKLDLDQEPVYNIQNVGRGFYVTTHNKIRYVRWSKYSVNEYDLEGEISSVRYSGSGFMAVYNKTNDKSNNSVVLLTNSGKKTSEFDIKGILCDIRYSRGRVYTAGSNKISIFDRHGEMLRSGACDFGAVRMVVVGSNTVCIMTDSRIQKNTVNKE